MDKNINWGFYQPKYTPDTHAKDKNVNPRCSNWYEKNGSRILVTIMALDEITMFGFCDFHIIGLSTNITPRSLTKIYRISIINLANHTCLIYSKLFLHGSVIYW
jgi:hypothetical protein